MIKKRIFVFSLVVIISLFFSVPSMATSQETEVLTNVELTEIESSDSTSNSEQVPTEKVKAEKKPITIMYYCDADNDLESLLLNDIQEAKNGITDEINFIALVDRHDYYSSNRTILGSNFADTRLYEIHPQKAKRISGGEEFPEITTTSNNFEANMGDAHTLKSFIDFCKNNYDSDKYVLILSNHGGGPKLEDDLYDKKAICWDETNGNDTLYTGEISDVLTAEQSVDVFGLDACFMGNSEFAYQFHEGNGGFQADVLVGCATSEWGDGWKYDDILSRLQTKSGDNGENDITMGGKEKYYSPDTITNAEIGAIIVEEQRDACEGYEIDQTLSCYDMSEIVGLKNAIDDLAISIKDEKSNIETLKGDISYPLIMCYYSESSQSQQLNYPFFDVYDFAQKINENDSLGFSQDIKNKAQEVMRNADSVVLYSYGGDKYENFKDGKNGITIFFPSGDAEVYKDRRIQNHFESQYWYSPLDLTHLLALGDSCYGKLKWCQDGQNEAINEVGNWFELLDSWYDYDNELSGGWNDYQW